MKYRSKPLSHFIELLDDADTIGRQLLSEAIYAARHGHTLEAEPDDLREIARDRPETLTAGQAKAAIACELLATDDGRDRGRGTLAERVGVEPDTVVRWVSGDREPSGPAVTGIDRVLEEHA